jgi:hypothetical protein
VRNTFFMVILLSWVSTIVPRKNRAVPDEDGIAQDATRSPDRVWSGHKLKTGRLRGRPVDAGRIPTPRPPAGVLWGIHQPAAAKVGTSSAMISNGVWLTRVVAEQSAAEIARRKGAPGAGTCDACDGGEHHPYRERRRRAALNQMGDVAKPPTELLAFYL